MDFTSPSFIGFVLVAALLTQMFSAPAGRSVVLMLASIVFIVSYVDTPLQLAPLAAFLLLCFASVEWVRRQPRTGTLGATLMLIILVFIYLKKFAFLEQAWLLPFPYLIAGLSYILFRVLHLMIDAQSGELAGRIGPLQFFNYTCNFLTFTAGPIQRYQDYAAQQARTTTLDAQRVHAAFARVIKGYLKVAVVSATCNYLFVTVSQRILASGGGRFPEFQLLYLAAALFYTVYLYANFAGYMDIVIGVGWLLGQELPENFNAPFTARSFLDFWARWHMTLSTWFKTYLFNPLVKALMARIPAPAAAPYLGVTAFFVTFLVMGVWHGTTSVFVVYGLLMGAGASINKLWQVQMNSRLGKKRYRALAETLPYIYLARGLTTAYFALALTCLWTSMAQLLQLVHALGLPGTLGGFVALTLAVAVVYFLWDRLMALLAGTRRMLARAAQGPLTRHLALAIQILLIVTVASFFHRSPEFVYRAF
ncbi:MAG: MBOAT family O-acyltransferase [Steroidobacteraceae bacterium]